MKNSYKDWRNPQGTSVSPQQNQQSVPVREKVITGPDPQIGWKRVESFPELFRRIGIGTYLSVLFTGVVLGWLILIVSFALFSFFVFH